MLAQNGYNKKVKCNFWAEPIINRVCTLYGSPSHVSTCTIVLCVAALSSSWIQSTRTWGSRHCATVGAPLLSSCARSRSAEQVVQRVPIHICTRAVGREEEKWRATTEMKQKQGARRTNGIEGGNQRWWAATNEQRNNKWTNEEMVAFKHWRCK